MLQLNKLVCLFCVFSFAANAGLYGIDSANPLTKEEKNIKSAFLQRNIINYPQKMRDNVIMLSDYAKKNNPNFQIIVHEGQELIKESSFERGLDGYFLAMNSQYDDGLFSNKQHSPKFARKYLNAIDGIVKNDIFFKDNKTKFIEDANTDMIETFSDVKDYWVITHDEDFIDQHHKIEEIKNSNYDMVVINPMFKNKTKYSKEDIKSMSYKKNGAKRLLLAEINLAEISPNDYRFKEEWKIGAPSWLKRKSLVEPNAIITEYWNNEWKKLLSRHFKAALASGYGGVFLTGADNHKYFEFLTPVE